MTRAYRSRRPVTSSPTRPKPLVVILIASSTRGVAALVGNTYGAAKDVGVYVTGEAIRGLADLEAKERERCANFASKAVAAGLAERQVRLAERKSNCSPRSSVASSTSSTCHPIRGDVCRRWFVAI